jgi:hypothetical protein
MDEGYELCVMLVVMGRDDDIWAAGEDADDCMMALQPPVILCPIP